MASPLDGNLPTHTSTTPDGVSPTETKLNAEHAFPPRRNGGSASADIAQHSTEGTSESEDAAYASPPFASEFKDPDCGSWQDAPNSKCHASFGDQGTTATVGAFGQLLQFSDFLGVGSSGIFSADHASVIEPCLISGRARKIQNLSDQPFHIGEETLRGSFYGLRFPGLTMKPNCKPHLKWTFWRWPCHTYPQGSFDNFPMLELTIQWVVHEKTVLQQCLLDNRGSCDIEVDVMFHKSMMIRDLDHLDWHYEFNENEGDKYDAGPGPRGDSWVFVHQFESNVPSEDTSSDTRSRHSNTGSPGDLQELEDMVASPVPPSRDSNHNDEDFDVSPTQENGPGIYEPPPETSVSRQSESANLSKINQTQELEQHCNDHDGNSKSSHGVSVISAVAIDGKIQTFGDDISPPKWTFVLKPQPKRDSRAKSQTVEVTAAYQMRVVDDPKTEWRTFHIPLHNMKLSEVFRQQQSPYAMSCCVAPFEDLEFPQNEDGGGATIFRTPSVPIDPPIGIPSKSTTLKIPSSPESHLGFAAWRNLEHILSVCTVPVTSVDPDAASFTTLPETLSKVDAVAITCGDMSGHRICWSASFFAFQFLVAFYKILRRLQKEQHQSVLSRIERACLGHLKWLHLAEQGNCGQRFGANYWVSGKLIDKPSSRNAWIAPESFLDTGFQILKAEACTGLLTGNDTTARLMSEWALSWISSLDKADTRKKYAWPHAHHEGVNAFRLDEHVWIWRALKALESNNHQAWKFMSDQASEKDDVARLRNNFSSDVVQREVSKRFTTENDVVQKRMLAVARSARETRFLLHSRDTTLFYDEIFSFSGEETSTQELLRRTVDCQMYHDENEESGWENSLRYALCIMLGSRGLSINNKSPEELVRTATEVLFRSSSPNGFFPGEIDTLKKKPVDLTLIADSDRDFYYHASFEIPYILLTHANEVRDIHIRIAMGICEAIEPKPNHSRKTENHDERGSESIQPISQNDRKNNRLQRHGDQSQLPLHRSDIRLSQQSVAYFGSHAFGDIRRNMKKTMPFNSLIDVSNIVKLEDEWLFAFPEFFKREDSLERDDYNKFLEYLGETAIFPAPSSTRSSNGSSNEFSPYPLPPYVVGLWADGTLKEPSSVVVDVPSSKLIGGKEKGRQPEFHDCSDHGYLWVLLSRARKVQHSKKRLLYFHKTTKDAASICYYATEVAERDNLLNFFEKHSLYRKHASDQCSMVHNNWETELHMSFYQLLEPSSHMPSGIATSESKPFPGGQEKQIARASVSFRFRGDFFDRYWTCYVLEQTQNEKISSAHVLLNKEHRQRKVLEQRYFADILKALIESTEKILTEVKHCLGVDHELGTFATPIDSNTAYLSWGALWLDFEPLLEILDDDIASTQVIVDQWEAREEDRGKEQPRWTRNDETKYRASITKIHLEVKNQTTKLRQLHGEIKLLRDRCSNRLVKARDELSFRSGQNIATFTYVTVVFLPLGFTSSIFSMNGAPETSVVTGMVAASAAALAITVVALVNASALAGMAEKLSIGFAKFTAHVKQSSVMRSRQISEKEGSSFTTDAIDTAVVRASSKDSNSWDLIFWAGYILLEIPARTITAACRALGWSPHNIKDGKESDGCKITEESREAETSPASSDASSGSPSVHQDAEMGPAPRPTSQETSNTEDESGKTSHKHIKTVARVLLGFLTVPVFLATWIIHLLCFNAWDALTLLGELLRRGINHALLFEKDGSESRLMTDLTKPPEKLRPMKKLKNILPPEKNTSKVKASTKQ